MSLLAENQRDVFANSMEETINQQRNIIKALDAFRRSDFSRENADVGRNLSIAITEAENAMLRAINAVVLFKKGNHD